MAEYIEREKIALGVLGLTIVDPSVAAYADAVLHQVQSIPAADVAPVRHGRWVLGTVEPGYLTPGGNRPWICSECKRVISWSLGRPYENYCPNCGAKMDGDADAT